MRYIHAVTVILLYAAQLSALSLDHPVTFDDDSLGTYTVDHFKKDWGMKPTSSSGQATTPPRLAIVADPQNPSDHLLEVTYLAHQVGGNSAMTFSAPLGASYDHLILKYQVKFADNFVWKKGGKLPGLTSSPDSPTGCIDNDTFDGFSARYMWREDGLIWGYIYNPEKIERCGDYYAASPPFYFQPGQWYTLKQEVFLGAPGGHDGYINVWVDDQPIISITNIQLRRSSTVGIDQIKMDTFFGGSTADWQPDSDQHAYFNNFELILPSGSVSAK